MAKVSVVIPSRGEQFLIPTVDDVLRNATGEVEVIVIHEGPPPETWGQVQQRHDKRLTTIQHGEAKGMRQSINEGVASASSRGAKYILKLDAHCSLASGWDEVLKADCDDNWIVIPRRLRLEPETWTIAEPDKAPYDYHYLSFPDDPQDFGGPGLNGKPWPQRQKARAKIMVDDEMSSQGSCWFMQAAYFNKLELMDEVSYGPFWNEAQELFLKCWLSGGRGVINKNTTYAHLHKGKKYGRGYRLDESWLKQGRNHTMNWIWNEAWDKQTLPFSFIIEHFWPVPSWPENWQEILYATRKPRAIGVVGMDNDTDPSVYNGNAIGLLDASPGLTIHDAHYGIVGDFNDVTARVQELVKDDALDIVVNNDTITPDQNPYRGKKKTLWVRYSYEGGERVTVERSEKDWLIIGRAQQPPAEPLIITPAPAVDIQSPLSATALNDFLIREFNLNDEGARRLRAPMPVELRDFHRNDLAKLFAELGFRKGAEVGVAEGHYSEQLCLAIPDLELLCVDPWHAYSDNPQNHTKEHHEFSYNETKRRLAPYPKAQMIQKYSMDAVREVPQGSLDFVYIDGNHRFDYCLQDIIEWAKRVRQGGIVSGDDYYELSSKWNDGGVVEAVQAYTRAHKIVLWFICTAPRSVDWFFVKE